MRYRVEMRTDDPELIEVLDRVRNRARFVKKALTHFISSKQGKKTFRAMSRTGTSSGICRHSPARKNVNKKGPAVDREREKAQERRRVEESDIGFSDDAKRETVYDFDRFI